MTLKDLEKEYDRLQKIYGDPSLHSIYSGGCAIRPDLMFVFMNPTAKNIASSPEWSGIRAPWLSTKTIWDLFCELGLIKTSTFENIKKMKPKDWTPEFADEVYEDVSKHKTFITNLGKCNQIDARSLSDSVYLEYLDLLRKEIEITKPKVVILLGNQVSSIVLGEKISVSQVRKKCFNRQIAGCDYKFYSCFYPVGNGRFNIDKTIEDIKWIMKTEL